jgi:hypothetical protein
MSYWLYETTHRKHQSVIDRKKSSGAKLDVLVGDLQRKHFDFVDNVVIVRFDFVNEFARSGHLQENVHPTVKKSSTLPPQWWSSKRRRC